MYRIIAEKFRRWTVVDSHAAELFTGTLRQCEDWLDVKENMQRASVPRQSWFLRIWDMSIRKFRTQAAPNQSSRPLQDGSR